MQKTHTEIQSSVSRQTEETILLQEKTAAVIERVIEERFRQLIESTTSRDEATERITETFDTTQPVDSITGTPPLQHRVTERTKSREKNDTRTQQEDTSACRTEADITIENNLDKIAIISENGESHENNEIESQDEYKRSDAIMILGIGVGIMIALFMIWLLTTIGKAIKFFLNPD